MYSLHYVESNREQNKPVRGLFGGGDIWEDVVGRRKINKNATVASVLLRTPAHDSRALCAVWPCIPSREDCMQYQVLHLALSRALVAV
jgi:hypothetical protein